MESEVELSAPPVASLTFLVEAEPWHKNFLGNLAGQFPARQRSQLQPGSAPGKFWPDVFVASPLPWSRFLESICYHVAGMTALLLLYPYLPRPTQVVNPSVFSKDDVIYYKASEYLPPLDTGGPKLHLPQKGEPEFSKQPILSVPPNPDNQTQTIVAPPQIKLNQEVPLPNLVARMPVRATVALSATTRSVAAINMPALPSTIIAPTAELAASDSRRQVRAPQAAVVAPAPDTNALSMRRLADISIAHSDAVAPAPQLPLSERRALPSAPLGNAGARAVPPPPSIQPGDASSNSGQQMIALGIHPVEPGAPVQPPAGNRRGTFAATPEGAPGAPGTPERVTGANRAAAGSANRAQGIPPGLVVGAAPQARGTASGDSPLIANAAPPRVASVPREPASQTNPNPTELEKQVFGDKKSYSMTLNLPNLNSQGGSWIVHFAELANDDLKGDLVAPVATKEVDPGYPIELMRRNVQGSVTLYAIIHHDGSVGEVRVLRSVDDRLDEYACVALAHWRFRPATKNGYPVDLEAVVVIPFKPMRMKSNF